MTKADNVSFDDESSDDKDSFARESVIAKITFEVSRIFCDLSSNVLFVMRIPVTNLFPV